MNDARNVLIPTIPHFHRVLDSRPKLFDVASMSSDQTQNRASRGSSERYHDVESPSASEVAAEKDQVMTNGAIVCGHMYRRRDIRDQQVLRCEECEKLAQVIGYVCALCGKRLCLDCDVAVRRAAGWGR